MLPILTRIPELIIAIVFALFAIGANSSHAQTDEPDGSPEKPQAAEVEKNKTESDAAKKLIEPSKGDEDKNRKGVSETDEPNSSGQDELDKAFELKITASSTRDLDKIADLCESAIEKGLDEESTEQAKELWASVLLDHAKHLNRQIAPNGRASTRWRWFRKQAISRLQEAIEIRPDKIEPLILLAELHSLGSGDRDAAVAAIEKAIAKIANDNETLSKALFIRSRLAIDDHARIADLTQAVKIDPENIDALMQRAIYFLKNEKNEEAVVDFKSLLATENDNIQRYVAVAQLLRQSQMFKESAEILDLAIEFDKENDELFVLRGQAFLANENDDAALKDLNQALQINRQNADALNLRARVYLVQEEYEKALEDANELMQQEPDSSIGLGLRSLIYRSQNELDKAIDDVETLLGKQPDNLVFMMDLAMLLTANDAPSKAIKLYDSVLRQTRDEVHASILRSRGDAYLSLGQHRRAIDDYELALELVEEYSEPDSSDSDRERETKSGLLNNLAWVLATSPNDEIRDGQRAIELATEASELTDYKAAFILSTLASGYADTGDFETARKWASKAVEFAESDEQRVGLQEELDSYEKDEAWRELENVEADNKQDELDDNESTELLDKGAGQKPGDSKSSEDDSADKKTDENEDEAHDNQAFAVGQRTTDPQHVKELRLT